MIHEIDDALRALVRRDALNGGTDVDVAFDAPTKDWSSRRGSSPTIDVYLYDIREDLRRRELGRVPRRADNGRVEERLLPPRWFKLSYLVTAWTQRPEDEHRLLAATLGAFLRVDSLPRDLLVGSLAQLGLPVPVTVAVPPPEDRALSDTWSALGGELKPSIDVVVIAPFDLGRSISAGPPVLEELHLRISGGEDGPGEQTVGADGRAGRNGEAATATTGKGRAGKGRAGKGRAGNAKAETGPTRTAMIAWKRAPTKETGNEAGPPDGTGR